eukprot:TRINITY_DN32477_c0_g1_i1.p1 TRINITY_DN32477_c0_g1~~TRINITY_DN32477_c0_g1_i1.p1  ORF type:complete len:702 (-),score=291.97 TRINITY_DN32477_c0_g1_i1:120-2225(-)
MPTSKLLVVKNSSSKSDASGKTKPVAPEEERTHRFETLHTGLAAYQPEDVIGPSVFQKGLTQRLKDEALHSDTVQAAIDAMAADRNGHFRAKLQQRAKHMLDTLSADFDEKVTRGMVMIVQKILQQLYNGIDLNEKHLERLREVSRKAQQEGVPLIIMPSHKSHIDYLVVSYLFFRCDLSLPFVAAGINLNFPMVGPLLRKCGAFFIRRSFEDDALYKAVFAAYFTTVLSHGYNTEFFVEGGRSRTGKLLRPRMGMMSLVVDNVLTGKVPDAYIVPVSIGYDKVIETESYVRELLGKPKEQESLWELLRSVRLLQLDFGRVDVRIARPFSVKEFLQHQVASRRLRPMQRVEDKRVLTQVLAYSVVSRINRTSVILATSLVAAALLTHHGRGMSLAELVAKFDWIAAQIKKRNGKVSRLEGGASAAATAKAVAISLGVLGNLVGKQKQVLEQVYTPAKRFELSYYRNQMVHLFVNEGMVCCSVYAATKTKAVMGLDQLRKDTSFIAGVLKLEVVHAPGTDAQAALDSALQLLRHDDAVVVDTTANTVSGPVTKPGMELFDFLCALFWPFIDAHWLMCCSFYALWRDNIIEEKVFLNRVQSIGFTSYYEGELNYYEAISKETLGNALDLFLGMSVVERRVINTKNVSVIMLHPSYHNEATLIALIDRIGRFRRIGKYTGRQSFEFAGSKMQNIVTLARPKAKI